MAMASRRRGRSPPPAASPSRDIVPAVQSPPNFPPDLLREIASRVTSLQEFFALRAVCRAALPLDPSTLASQAPLLLVPDAAAASHALFHIHRGFHRFRLTRTHLTGEMADIHSLGCRVAVDLRARCQLRIVHVLTGERTRLPSPPSPFSGLLLSGDLVVAWYWNRLSLQYCRLGNPKWRVASTCDPYRFHDLIFVNGTLYALVTPGHRLAVLRLSDNSNSEVLELRFLGDRNVSTGGRSVFSGGNLGTRSGTKLLALVDAPCFLQTIVLQGAWVLIIRVFVATAYTTQSRGSFEYTLWLMNLLPSKLLTTQLVKYPWSFVNLFGSFPACVDALDTNLELQG